MSLRGVRLSKSNWLDEQTKLGKRQTAQHDFAGVDTGARVGAPAAQEQFVSEEVGHKRGKMCRIEYASLGKSMKVVGASAEVQKKEPINGGDKLAERHDGVLQPPQCLGALSNKKTVGLDPQRSRIQARLVDNAATLSS